MRTSEDNVSDAGALLHGLFDEMLAYFIDWQRDARAVAEAYRRWSDAPASEKAPRFASYMAALDEEEAAAARYALVAREVERALRDDHLAAEDLPTCASGLAEDGAAESGMPPIPFRSFRATHHH